MKNWYVWLFSMGAALLPRSVLSTFPESKRLTVYPLGRDVARLRTLLIWRKEMASPRVRALADLLTGKNRDGGRTADRHKR